MNIIKCVGKDRLKKLIRSTGEFQYICISEVLKRKDFPKKSRVQFYDILLPPPNTVNTLCVNGMKEYRAEYEGYINRPECQYLINELICNGIQYDLNIALVIALDEDDYEYLNILADNIEDMYGISSISVKKYLAGKESGFKKNLDSLLKNTLAYRKLLEKKLKDSYIDPMKLFANTIHEDDVKDLPKDLRRKVGSIKHMPEYE